MMTAKQRWVLLGTLLAITLGAAFWLDSREDDEGADALRPLAAAPRVKQPDSRAEAPRGETLRLARFGEGVIDIFNSSRAPDAGAAGAVETEVAEPEPEGPPPLPFTYMGKLAEQNRITVFLASESGNWAVTVGSVINETYRVEAIAPPEMILTYLPMGATQRLAIGEIK